MKGNLSFGGLEPETFRTQVRFLNHCPLYMLQNISDRRSRNIRLHVKQLCCRLWTPSCQKAVHVGRASFFLHSHQKTESIQSSLSILKLPLTLRHSHHVLESDDDIKKHAAKHCIDPPPPPFRSSELLWGKIALRTPTFQQPAMRLHPVSQLLCYCSITLHKESHLQPKESCQTFGVTRGLWFRKKTTDLLHDDFLLR